MYDAIGKDAVFFAAEEENRGVVCGIVEKGVMVLLARYGSSDPIEAPEDVLSVDKDFCEVRLLSISTTPDQLYRPGLTRWANPLRNYAMKRELAGVH